MSDRSEAPMAIGPDGVPELVEQPDDTAVERTTDARGDEGSTEGERHAVDQGLADTEEPGRQRTPNGPHERGVRPEPHPQRDARTDLPGATHRQHGQQYGPPVWSIRAVWMGMSPWCIPVMTSGRKRPPSTKPAKAPPFASSKVAAVPIATETKPATDIRTPRVIERATRTATVGTTMSAMASGVTRRMNRST